MDSIVCTLLIFIEISTKRIYYPLTLDFWGRTLPLISRWDQVALLVFFSSPQLFAKSIDGWSVYSWQSKGSQNLCLLEISGEVSAFLGRALWNEGICLWDQIAALTGNTKGDIVLVTFMICAIYWDRTTISELLILQ